MHLLSSHSSRCQALHGTAEVIILSLFTHVSATNTTHASATNLTERYRLCKTDIEVETLQRTYDLIRVDAEPTHGALQPAWPETLITMGISIYTVITLGKISSSVWKVVIFNAVIPFLMVLAWTISFVVAEINYKTAGWISCNLATSINFLATSDQYEESGIQSGIGGLASGL